MLRVKFQRDCAMQIDLNADLGEGAPHDRELLTIVSSANISCGVHAGDANTIANAIRLAQAHGVRIGAHPSFPDRENFGRKAMLLPVPSLRNHLLYQLHALRGMVHTQGAQLTHIKPHGALYNQAAVDSKLAADGTLVPRADPRAIIHDPQQAVSQCLEMICEGKVTTLEGQRIDMRVDTVCLHGDTAQALIFAQSLATALSEAGIAINHAVTAS